MSIRPTIKQILADNRSLWDNTQTSHVDRKNFQKVLDCRTFALGAEVYASENGQRKSFPRTCKSRACSSCRRRATLIWQRDVAAMLPDVPFAGIGLTMPDVLWTTQIRQPAKHKARPPLHPTRKQGLVKNHAAIDWRRLFSATSL